MVPNPSSKPRERNSLSLRVKTDVLTEADYRCAVPTCRQILALDLHQIWEVNARGEDSLGNLIALCPTCHALYHRGTITKDSIYAYKAMLEELNGAFDKEAIDLLIFLHEMTNRNLVFSSDGILKFARLIASHLVHVTMGARQSDRRVGHMIWLTDRGRIIIDAWMAGNRDSLRDVLSGLPPASAIA